MITINDIDVFILSYNREQYIQQTIDSLLKQTVGSFNIKILDNGSNDNTEKIIKNLNNKNIEFVSSEKKNGVAWNFLRAQNLASRKYVMLFHDDDLLHPKYLEYAIKAINTNNNASLVSSGMFATHSPHLDNFKAYQYNPLVFDNLADFTSLIYLGFPLNFATAIYKTENFKRIKINFQQYGKVADRPFMYDSIQDGKIVLFTGQYVQYRLHETQDSRDNKTGPFLNETIALHKKYKEIVFNQKKILPKIFFLLNFYKYINDEHARIYGMTLSKSSYIQKAKTELAISNKSFIFSKISYFLKLNYLYKIYRYCRLKCGEYS